MGVILGAPSRVLHVSSLVKMCIGRVDPVRPYRRIFFLDDFRSASRRGPFCTCVLACGVSCDGASLVFFYPLLPVS
jgi:hypothetical protein